MWPQKYNKKVFTCHWPCKLKIVSSSEKEYNRCQNNPGLVEEGSLCYNPGLVEETVEQIRRQSLIENI